MFRSYGIFDVSVFVRAMRSGGRGDDAVTAAARAQKESESFSFSVHARVRMPPMVSPSGPP